VHEALRYASRSWGSSASAHRRLDSTGELDRCDPTHESRGRTRQAGRGLLFFIDGNIMNRLTVRTSTFGSNCKGLIASADSTFEPVCTVFRSFERTQFTV
jgi:hypothetical protein